MPDATPEPATVIGTYRLGSITARTGDGPFVDFYDVAPNGYAIITANRFMAVITAGGRRFGRTPAEKAALFDSLIAYTGTYRLQGDDFITEVDVSWIEYWNGTDQGRKFAVDARRLVLTTHPGPAIDDPSQTMVARVVWERIG